MAFLVTSVYAALLGLLLVGFTAHVIMPRAKTGITLARRDCGSLPPLPVFKMSK